MGVMIDICAIKGEGLSPDGCDDRWMCNRGGGCHQMGVMIDGCAIKGEGVSPDGCDDRKIIKGEGVSHCDDRWMCDQHREDASGR